MGCVLGVGPIPSVGCFIHLCHAVEMKMTTVCFSHQFVLLFLRWSLANHEYFALQHADSSNFYITEKVTTLFDLGHSYLKK